MSIFKLVREFFFLAVFIIIEQSARARVSAELRDFCREIVV